MWHSASSYECMKCGEEGDYLTIDRHVRECHHFVGEMKPGKEFSGNIEYHTCVMCEELIESDPHFINEHMSNKHRRSLTWYESKLKEMLMSGRVKKGIPKGQVAKEEKAANTV